jgi:hypothetical protein
MNRIALGVFGALFTLSAAVTYTQTATPPTIATDITAADVQTVITAPTGGGDRQMKVVDMGKYNVSVGVLRRGPTKPGAPVSTTRRSPRSTTSCRARGRCSRAASSRAPSRSPPMVRS